MGNDELIKFSPQFKRLLLSSIERFEQFTNKELEGLAKARPTLNDGEKIILDQFLSQFPNYLAEMTKAKEFLK